MKVFQIYSYRLLNDDITGVVVRIDDITYIEKKEQQLIQSQKMETIGNLAGGLAHDFNNVLGGILGSIELLNKTLNKEELQYEKKIDNYLNILKNSSLRAEDMVKQLLTLSRKNKFERRPIDLNISIKNVVEICKNSFPKSVSIREQYFNDTATVLADQTGIEQVILNIMVNASHAMTIMRDENEKRGGEVVISIEKIFSDDKFVNLFSSAKKDVYYYLIKIVDTGIGIDDNLKKNIFEPFFTTKDKNEGTGLGLSMVYNIIMNHKGFIDFYSVSGSGSTFNIFFPEYINKSEKKIEKIKENETLKGSGLILIIDDEDIIRDISKAILEDNSYDVLVANDGSSGIEIFKENQSEISAVLLDMSMPGMSGLDVYIELKNIKKDVKVLLSSGFRQDSRVNKAMELGVTGFISKPYGTEKLLKTIHDIL